MSNRAALYYESHVTINPVPEEQRHVIEELGKPFKFKLAKLLMEKSNGTRLPSTIDTFMTAHGMELDDMRDRVIGLVNSLNKNGFTVRRYKIEDTICDSRTADIYNIIK